MAKNQLNESASGHLVGVGASAGGLEALRFFFADMPEDSGLTFVVIQHLAPDHKSLMVELLQRATRLPVQRAKEGQTPLPNHIYLIPPRFNLTLSNHRFVLVPPPAGKALNLPIDIFFRSIASEYGDRAIAVILSGTGSDGARGIRAVKEAGGMIMVQAEASAKFAGMPTSAIATGAADFILPVEEMAVQLVQFASHPFAVPKATPTILPDNSTHLDKICTRLKETIGIDFSLYKHATFARRVERRMNILQVNDLSEYIHCLMNAPSESESLGKDLLISVTKFFRDSEAFTALRNHLESLFRDIGPGGCLRIWDAACATGEEAYSLAMLCEDLRTEQFPSVHFKIFATDVDRAALDFAGAGVYPRSVVADLPPEYLERFFQPEGTENFRINRSLRDRLIFARQDLLSDPPFTRLHMVSCRNLLIYLRPEAQKKLLSLIHFSLLANGLLFLGSSETLGELSYAFETLESKFRIYRKTGSTALKFSDSIPSFTDNPAWLAESPTDPPLHRRPRSAPPLFETVQQHLLKRFAPATLVITPEHELLYTVGPVDRFVRFTGGPVNLNLLKMVSRELGLAISTAASQALREKKVVDYRAIRAEDNSDEPESVRLQAEAFDGKTPHGMLVLITLMPDTLDQPQPEEAATFNQQHHLIERIQNLEEDLLNTRENLQNRFAHHNLQVLVVEDNPVNREVAMAIFRKLGIKILVAENGLAALEHLRGKDCDLVFTDLQMPEMDGFELFTQIRTPGSGVKNPAVPVIAMTAHAMHGAPESCRLAGMDDFVAKPVSPAVLARVISRWFPVGPEENRPKKEVSPALPEVLDFQGLCDRLMGDEPLALSLLDHFLEDFPEQICRLEKALHAKDQETARRINHTIKGAAANMNALEIHQIAETLQKTLSDSIAPESNNVLQRYREAHARLQTLYTNMDRQT